jgi:hypothetical protein
MKSNMTLLVSTYSQTMIANIENTWWRSPYRLVIGKKVVTAHDIHLPTIWESCTSSYDKSHKEILHTPLVWEQFSPFSQGILHNSHKRTMAEASGFRYYDILFISWPNILFETRKSITSICCGHPSNLFCIDGLQLQFSIEGCLS